MKLTVNKILKIQSCQNELLKEIFRAPKYVLNWLIHEDVDISTVNSFSQVQKSPRRSSKLTCQIATKYQKITQIPLEAY